MIKGYYFEALAQRNETLLVRKSGAYQIRFAARKAFVPPVYHEPPRKTRPLPEGGPFGLRSGALP